VVVDKKARLEGALLAVSLDGDALAECAFWVYDDEAADFSVG